MERCTRCVHCYNFFTHLLSLPLFIFNFYINIFLDNKQLMPQEALHHLAYVTEKCQFNCMTLSRVPTVMEKSWKMTGHGKVMEKSWKIIGHGKVMEFSRSWKKSWKTQIWTNLFCRFCRTSCFERVLKFCNKYF